MKFYMKQRAFSLMQNFDIYNEDGESEFTVMGEFNWFKRIFHIYDSHTQEKLATIKQKNLFFVTSFEIFVHDNYVATVQERPAFFKTKLDIAELNWEIKGALGHHDYSFIYQDNTIATVHKKFFAWTDSFQIEIIDDSIDPIYVISTVLTIDTILDNKSNTS